MQGDQSSSRVGGGAVKQLGTMETDKKQEIHFQ